MSAEQAQPTISVDRMVGHYLDDIEINVDDLSGYYDTLPIPGKLPLEECHIHFSGLGHHDGPMVGHGVYFNDPEDSKQADPQAPPAHIVIFIGSALATNSQDRLGELLGGELADYADDARPNPISERERELAFRRTLLKGRVARTLFVAKAAMIGGLVEFADAVTSMPTSLEDAAVFGLGGAVLHSLIVRKRKRERLKAIDKELYSIYEARALQKQAREEALPKASPSLVATTQRDLKPPVIFREHKSRDNPRVDLIHQYMSVLAPEDYVV